MDDNAAGKKRPRRSLSLHYLVTLIVLRCQMVVSIFKKVRLSERQRVIQWILQLVV
jgi:hypothetical protein